MRKKAYIIILLLLPLLPAAGELYAQRFEIGEIDDSNFPQMRAYFKALTPEGDLITNFDASDLEIIDNGQPREVKNTGVSNPDKYASFILVLDKSAELSNKRLNIADNSSPSAGRAQLDAGVYFVNSIPFDNAECAVVAYSHFSEPKIGFSTNKQLLTDSFDSLLFVGRRDYNAGLYRDRWFGKGALEIIPMAQFDPVIIFITGGPHSDDFSGDVKTDEIISLANVAGAEVNCITLSDFQVPEQLKRIANQTGGSVFSAVKTIENLKNILVKLVNQTIFKETTHPCFVEWESDCDDGRVRIAFRSIADEKDYTIRESVKPYLEVEPRYFSFKNVKPGDFRDTNLTITAKVGKVRITEIIPEVNDFSIYYGFKELPVELEPGETLRIKVRYQAGEEAPVNSEFDIVSTACSGGIFYHEAVLYAGENCCNNKDLKIYPNPVESHFHVEIDDDIINKVTDAELYSSSGELIKKIDISELLSDGGIMMNDISAGVYFLKINFRNGVKTMPIIFENR